MVLLSGIHWHQWKAETQSIVNLLQTTFISMIFQMGEPYKDKTRNSSSFPFLLQLLYILLQIAFFCNFIKFPRLSNKVLKLLWQDFIFIGLDGFIDQNHLLSIWIDRLTSKSYYLILSSVWRSMSSPSFFQATFVICWTVAFLTRLRLGGSASRTQNQKVV